MVADGFVVRILYIISAIFVLSAILTDSLAVPVLTINGVLLDAELASLFPIYTAFFLVCCIATFVNLNRARQRCLTAGSKRRMGIFTIRNFDFRHWGFSPIQHYYRKPMTFLW